MRIASLLPSATEIVALLGAGDLLVARSHECDQPPSVRRLPSLTSPLTRYTTSADVDRGVSASLSTGASLYRLDVDTLHALAPDLIITQDLCRVCSVDLGTVRAAAASMSRPPAVLSLNPHSFEDVLDDIARVAEALGPPYPQRAARAIVALRERFFRAADHVNAFADPVPTLFMEWTDPPYIAGHWTAQLIERAGGEHTLNPTSPMPGAGAGAGGQMAHRTAPPSRRVTPDQIVASAPRAVIICPCGLSLGRVRHELSELARHDWWRQLPAVTSRRVALVDGNLMFNRPSPSLVTAYEWLVAWLNHVPELIPDAFPWAPADPYEHARPG